MRPDGSRRRAPHWLLLNRLVRPPREGCSVPVPMPRREDEKSALGHEERLPPTRLSAGYGFRKETIAGVRHNERDAPIPNAGS